MINTFLNVPAALNTDAIKQDVDSLLNHNKPTQRYSRIRDSFVTLSREFDEFVMKDWRTGSEHRLSVDATNAERLTAHWTQFTSANTANI